MRTPIDWFVIAGCDDLLPRAVCAACFTDRLQRQCGMPSVAITRRSTPESKSPSKANTSLTDALAPVQHMQFSDAAEKVKSWADTHGTGKLQRYTIREMRSSVYVCNMTQQVWPERILHVDPGYAVLTPMYCCLGNRNGVWGISGAAGAALSLAGTLLLMCCCPAFAIYL